MKTRFVKATALILTAATLLSGCGGSGNGGAQQVDLNSLSLDEIVAKAQEEGEVNSVGMPDDWANWDDTWAGLKEEYGLEHTDVDLSSAEELSMFETEKNNATKDIGDVGETYGAVAEEQGLTLKKSEAKRS